MDEERALTTAPLTEVQALSKAFHASGLFADVTSEAAALVKIWAGRELGIGAVEAMRGIHIINGNLALSAGLIAAQIKRSARYDYRIDRQTNERCVIEFSQNGAIVGSSEFTIADAQAAGLAGKATWKAYPSDLLFARALTRGARRFCPDVFGGAVYTSEEISVIDTEWEALPEPAETPAPPDVRVETGTSAPPPRSGAGNAPHCPTHSRYPMRSGKGGEYYCSAKAAPGEPANDKGYCSYRLPYVADAPPMFDGGQTTDEAALRKELWAALVRVSVTPTALADYLSSEGLEFEGQPKMAQITAFAQERGVSFAALADAVAASAAPPFE